MIGIAGLLERAEGRGKSTWRSAAISMIQGRRVHTEAVSDELIERRSTS